ncbi:MAG TPA: TIGR03667 family PPOX class F420-dependent oxidoreductase, partial [Candidatus Xenobia bacterium]
MRLYLAMLPIEPAILKRLQNEGVIWLTTVSPDGQPQASVVWFLWQDDHCLIYSKADAPKLAAIRQHPKVALNLNSSAQGGEVVTFDATAQIVAEHPTADKVPQYVEKYRD